MIESFAKTAVFASQSTYRYTQSSPVYVQTASELGPRPTPLSSAPASECAAPPFGTKGGGGEAHSPTTGEKA